MCLCPHVQKVDDDILFVNTRASFWTENKRKLLLLWNQNVYSAFELKVLIIELVLMLLLGLIASNISPSDSISGYLNEGGRVGVGGGGMNEKNLDGVFWRMDCLGSTLSSFICMIYVDGTFGGGSKEKSCSKYLEI